jgi:hypothetical protein
MLPRNAIYYVSALVLLAVVYKDAVRTGQRGTRCRHEMKCQLWTVTKELQSQLRYSSTVFSPQLLAEYKVKVKVPLTHPKGPEGGRGIALLSHDLGARRGQLVSVTPRPLYPRERRGTHCTGGWVSPRAGLDVCEKSGPNRIRSPDRPDSSQLLYRLS